MKRCLTLIAAILLLITLFLSGCGDDGTDKGFRFPLEREPSQLDPQVSADASSMTVLAALFEGLTRLDDAGKPIPGAADYTVSADGCTYTFTLRESYWSSISIRGEDTPWDEPTRVVADDFVFGFQRAIDPDTASPLATELYGILNAKEIHQGIKGLNSLGVVARDEKTLVITLTAPDEQFLYKLATAPFMPCNREFFHYTSGRYGLEKRYLLSNGAFSLTAWNHGESLLLSRHEGYDGAAEITPQAVRFVIGTADPVTALQEGTMDAAALTAAEVTKAETAGLQLLSLQDSVRSVFFNTRHIALADRGVRRALCDATEWHTLYAFLEEKGEPPAVGYIAPDAVTTDGSVYRNEDNARLHSIRGADAVQTLHAALARLYPDEQSPALPRLTVLAADDEVSANLARYLVQSWQRNLSIYCGLELVSESELTSRLNSGSYQIAIGITVASGLSAAENLQSYTTGAAGNITGYSNEAFDRAVTAALHGSREEVSAAESLLWEECPSLPLSFPHRYYGLAANVENVLVRPFYGGAYGSPFSFRQAKKWKK